MHTTIPLRIMNLNILQQKFRYSSGFPARRFSSSDHTRYSGHTILRFLPNKNVRFFECLFLCAFSAQYPFFKRSQAGQKIPRSRKLGPAYPNAGAMTANPRHGSHIVSLCVLCMFSRMRSMKTSKNRVVLCIFAVFLFFSSLLYGILVFFLHHNFFSFPCFIYLFLKYFGHR